MFTRVVAGCKRATKSTRSEVIESDDLAFAGCLAALRMRNRMTRWHWSLWKRVHWALTGTGPALNFWPT